MDQAGAELNVLARL